MIIGAEFDGLVGWCKAEVERLRLELVPLEAGTLALGKRLHDGDWEDITQGHAAWIKQRIVALDDLIITYALPI